MNPTTAGKLSTSQAPENSVAGLANVDTSKKVEPPKLESKEKCLEAIHKRGLKKFPEADPGLIIEPNTAAIMHAQHAGALSPVPANAQAAIQLIRDTIGEHMMQLFTGGAEHEHLLFHGTMGEFNQAVAAVRRMRWTNHVAGAPDVANAYTVTVEKKKGQQILHFDEARAVFNV